MNALLQPSIVLYRIDFLASVGYAARPASPRFEAAFDVFRTTRVLMKERSRA